MSGTLSLIPHPGTPVAGALGIDVACTLPRDGGLILAYRLRAPAGQVLIPPAGTPGRTDGLWRHTCFEAFVAGKGQTAYREFNFSPAGSWQAYAFHAYRRGGPLEPAAGPEFDCREEDGGFTLRAYLPAADLPAGPPWRLGLSAVLEAADGSLSYWALNHTSAHPDFHHPDTFTLEIPPP